MIKEYLGEKKPLIDEKIVEILTSKKIPLSQINVFGPDAIEKLIHFCTLGKSLRGVLVLLGAELYNCPIDDDLIELAAIMEIIHSAILIQDDIQDDDKLRRGSPTVWYQYEISAMDQNFKRPKFYGETMTLDVFMIGHYIALQKFTQLKSIDYEKRIEMLNFFTDEMIKIQVAQSQDIYHGYVHADKVSVHDIENVQLYKTGRYTISLPLMLGALYAGKKLSEIQDIEKIGEMLGVVFQIKDDELAIFANEAELGKKVGNDICENKKTHFRELLFQRANRIETMFLKTSFGNKNLSERKISRIKELIIRYGIRDELQQKMEKTGGEATEIINHLTEIDDKACKELLSLVDYLVHRTK